MRETLEFSSAHLVRTSELQYPPVIGSRELRGFLPARATLELDCAGEGWRVSASVSNSPIEEKASARRMVEALKMAIILVEAKIRQENKQLPYPIYKGPQEAKK